MNHKCFYFLLVLCSAKAMAQNISAPNIKFINTTFDFDTIEQESPGVCEFIFRNTGHEPLIIFDVNASCGCTKPQWHQKPVLPNDTGKIIITYNTNLLGSFRKNIVVHTNASKTPNVVLRVKGYVKKKHLKQGK